MGHRSARHLGLMTSESSVGQRYQIAFIEASILSQHEKIQISENTEDE